MEELSPVLIVHVVILCVIGRDYLRVPRRNKFAAWKTRHEIKAQDHVIVFASFSFRVLVAFSNYSYLVGFFLSHFRSYFAYLGLVNYL